MNPELDLDALLDYVRSEHRVCPMPDKWDAVWQSLPGVRRVGAGWEPPPPLILGGWWASSNGEKRERLALHLRYAAEHGVLDRVGRFLMALGPDDWLYDDERRA